MAEYIEREAVESLIQQYADGDVKVEETFLLTDLIGDITDIPAAEVQPVNRWISVEDRLPENRIDVLVYDTDCGIVIGWYDKEIGDFAADFISPLDAVTHWQSLPEPPKPTE